MDRMAKHTKHPEMLRELFDALGNDPFVIAECLVRPVLAERLMANFYRHHQDRLKLATVAWLKEPLESWRARAANQLPAAMTAPNANYSLPTISDGVGGCTDDTWTAASTANAPEGRDLHTAVWTGSEMIVWGGVHRFTDVEHRRKIQSRDRHLDSHQHDQRTFRTGFTRQCGPAAR